MKGKIAVLILGFSLLLILFPLRAVWATSSKTQLKQYVNDLQNDPDNQELREKIIRLARNIKPAIPEVARGNFIKAQTLMKDAKDKNEYELAISEYKQTLLAAPWWGLPYRYLAIALKKDEQFEAAENALKLYIATGPKNVRDAQDEIYVIDAKKEAAAHKNDWLKQLDGKRYLIREGQDWQTLDVKGNYFVLGNLYTPTNYYQELKPPENHLEIQGRQSTYNFENGVETTFTISDDGTTINSTSKNRGSVFVNKNYVLQQ